MPTATIRVFTTESFARETVGTFDQSLTNLQASDAQISSTRVEATAGEIGSATRAVVLTGSGFAVGENGPTSGTVTSISFHLWDASTQQLGAQIATMTGLNIGFVSLVAAVDASDAGQEDAFTPLWVGYDTVFDASAVTNAEYEFDGTDLNDVAIAGAGGSYMSLGLGADRYVGGTGWDQITFNRETGSFGVQVDLAAGTARDTYGNAETISGTIDALRGSINADTFLGDEISQALRGLAGNDVLDGRGGQDVVRYDRDARYGGTNGVIVDLAAGTATDGFGDSDTLRNIENVRGSDFGDDLYGDTGANVLQGLEGDDILMGRAGNDTLIGDGDGDSRVAGDAETIGDTASYAEASGGVQVYLSFGLSRGADGRDTLINIDNLTGGDFDDRLIGDANANQLSGGAGNDVMKGKGGQDTLDGGDGDDRLIGWLDSDDIFGGAGSDILIGLSGDDDLFGNEGDDFIYGGRDSDFVSGGLGADRLRGNIGNDTVNGGDGNDDLRGGGSNDALFGDGGNDYLLGENGRDTLVGGAGNDRLSGGNGGGVGDGFADEFLFDSSALGGGGTDTILDFENGLDVINLSSFGFTNFATDLLPLVTERAWGLSIDFGGGDVLQVSGMTLALFDQSDVLL